jgi:Uma2 family endonuclease
MAQAAPAKKWTEEEYLAFERTSETRHEFYEGEIFAMAGASRNHIFIVSNLNRHLGNALASRGCLIATTDMRTKVQQNGLYTYPDVVVICGEPQFVDEQVDTLLNPTLIIEVLSDSTEAYDRGAKFKLYEGIQSLNTYLLVSQDEPQVEQFVRQERGRWEFSRASGLEAILELPALRVSLPLAQIFENIKFPPRPLKNPPA